MRSTRVIKFLVNEDQMKKIKSNASLKGHKTVSSYLREIALEKDIKVENMIHRIYHMVMEDGI